MSNPHDVSIVDATLSLEPVPFRAPLKFGGRVVARTQLINVAVTVERSDGKRATGHGSMPVGNVWAWPSSVTAADDAEAAMIAFAQNAVASVVDIGRGHPVEIVTRLMSQFDAIAEAVRQEQSLGEPIPALARLVAASPLDAAIHDAYGRVHSLNSYRTLSEEFLAADLSAFLDDSFRGLRLDRCVLPNPKAKMPLYHLVGALDPLTDADIATRIDDGLPETLPEWIAADGLTHLKIKLSGENPAWDVDRVLAVDAVAGEAQEKRGCTAWWYSCDFNEKCASAAVVVEFLQKIRERNPQAFARIQYLEQPLPRRLHVADDQRVDEAASLKPVVIDESLVDYGSFLAAKELGYTGIALKACKGHTESLLMAAAAQQHGMFLCVQDLTCPGRSFLHSASLAAWVPGVAAIEGNARQYCPAPNAPWASRYPGLFDVCEGMIATGDLNGDGLGFE